MRNLIKLKSQYRRSKECSFINSHDGTCLRCVFWDSAYSHCSAFETGYDRVKMALLAENLERVRDDGREPLNNMPFNDERGLPDI